MSLGRHVLLNSGHKIPQLGYGTWQSAPGEVALGVFEALKVGYRHLDLAKVYGNQPEVAQGLKRAFREIPGLRREDIFIVRAPLPSLDPVTDSDVILRRPSYGTLVEAALDDCLDELELEYLDLYLVHFPISFKGSSNHVGQDLFPLTGGNQPDGDVIINDGISIIDTWRAMTKLPKSKARAIGVSNHSLEHLEAIINATSVVPAVNQIERHPLLRQDRLIEYCKDKNIHVTAYSAFGNNMLNVPLLFSHPDIISLAKKLSKERGEDITPTQVLLSWAQSGGHSVIPKSVTPARIADNFKEIDLSAADLAVVTEVGKEQRRYNIPYIARPSGVAFHKEALEQGHIVTAYGRSESKLPAEILQHPNHTFFKGELNDEEALGKASRCSASVLVSFLGPSGGPHNDSPVTNCYKCLVPLPIQNNISRALVLCTPAWRAPGEEPSEFWDTTVS
ncbi:hypothetical protein NM208_g9164 [Fusarium decemcellulare]|uniref:Uncharacterized protein n=1 Tax=Fusarium decemcellulare TaxID=57161 RepID=A0ACC1S367_9HYPO|nr:hypothetical protein NM208_g9164 [Fusarium decemcellulare]